MSLSIRRILSLIAISALLLSLGGCLVTSEDPTITNPAVPTGTADVTEPTSEPTDPTDPTQPPEPTEPPEPIDPPARISDSSFVRVKDYIPDIVVELRYATTDNFTGKTIYSFSDAYLRYGTVKKLAAAQELLKEKGLSLKIWDAFRPTDAQFTLWDICPDATYVSNPNKGYSSHSRGNTVDITLVDSDGMPVEMPSDFDDFSARADRDYSDCTAVAAANATLLEQVMENCGLKGYSAEWWHYTDTTSYDVNTCFDPSVISTWYPNCESHIGMLESPSYDGKLLTKIYKGEAITLLGWDRLFAFVDYQGQQGYVVPAYIKADGEQNPENLKIVSVTDTYSYEQLLSDMNALQATYPDLIRVDVIGRSELGRDIPVLLLGNPDAKYQVLLQGAIHAREHMTSWLLMSMAEYWAENGLAGCEDTCFHIIPMMNPDGVTLAQTAQLTELQTKIYKRDLARGFTSAGLTEYASQWKANGLGVDLNHSFDAGWKTTPCRGEPSSQNYNGTAPFEAAEAQALRDYTLALMPDVTISYHSHGSVIYYEYGKKMEVNAASRSLGIAARAVTGYLMLDSSGVGAAGYKDWCMDVLEIPSLTLEIGSYEAPGLLRETYAIYARNLNVLPAIVRWLQFSK